MKTKGIRLREADGSELTLVAQEDAFDLYIGRQEMYVFPVSLRVMLRLVWWVIKWWITCDWIGMKSLLRRRKLNSMMEKQCKGVN